MRKLAFLCLPLALTACDKQAPTPQPPQSPPAVVPEPTAPPPVETASPSPAPTPTETATPAAATPPPSPLPDRGALNERRDPERLLRFYAQALAARDWASAARAWGPGSGVSARTLKASYDRAEPPRLTIGRGAQEGAAGSLYYQAPVTLRFGSAGAPERGTLTLRRVNDVDGATPEQLRWHIEKSTIGAGVPASEIDADRQAKSPTVG